MATGTVKFCYLVPQENTGFFHVISSLLIKLVGSIWLDIDLLFERGQYPAILASRLVSNPYIHALKAKWNDL